MEKVKTFSISFVLASGIYINLGFFEGWSDGGPIRNEKSLIVMNHLYHILPSGLSFVAAMVLRENFACQRCSFQIG